ncbi:MAG: glucosaminidase domain-containing protein [Bacteroidales bacterium]|nr:glucosaminidase domain-containing protein [Bacteroidales bacterium]
MTRIVRSLLCIFSLLCALSVHSQQRNSVYEQYIEKYKDIAVEQMHRHKIPASITLAQGLLESGAGRSDLAQKSNNHFGIKRGNDWQGPTVTHNDDRHGEHFRKYKTVEEGYEDHSRFLLRERYQRLFRLDILDYKGWARGLKACGYATSPVYADRLIGIIELYKLYELDEDPNNPHIIIPEYEPTPEVHLNYRAITVNNGIRCTIARQNDTWEAIAQALRVPLDRLLDFNEAVEEIPLSEGDFVYLEKKATKGPKEMKGKWHKVTADDSMFSIAQRYGIRLRNLYKLNYKDDDYQPLPGDLLRVR